MLLITTKLMAIVSCTVTAYGLGQGGEDGKWGSFP